MIKRTLCIIRVDGNDVSSVINPRLINLSVTDKAGMSSDTVSIEIDDTGGLVLLPREGAAIEVLLGSNADGVALVFSGVVDEVRSKGSRNGGRTLSISGKGIDTKGKAKEPQEKHWDNETLGNVIQDAAKRGGIESVRIDPDLAKVRRPYWAMQGESFIHFAERIAREVGGTFKVANGIAILAKRNGGTSASGAALPTVRAVYGDNLISWDIAPVIGRPRYKKAKARWYDTKTATWKTEEVEIADPDAKAEFVNRFTAPDQEEAREHAESRKADSERGKGGGSITIDGNADAAPEGTVILVGARPGIDGTYRIDSVNHDFSRSSGWTTRLDIKQPQGEAGKDSRGQKKKSSSGPRYYNIERGEWIDTGSSSSSAN
jgi:Phage protein D